MEITIILTIIPWTYHDSPPWRMVFAIILAFHAQETQHVLGERICFLGDPRSAIHWIYSCVLQSSGRCPASATSLRGDIGEARCVQLSRGFWEDVFKCSTARTCPVPRFQPCQATPGRRRPVYKTSAAAWDFAEASNACTDLYYTIRPKGTLLYMWSPIPSIYLICLWINIYTQNVIFQHITIGFKSATP